MQTVIIHKDKQYTCEISTRLTSAWLYSAMVTILDGEKIVADFWCTNQRIVKWDTSWDAWDVLRSLGYKRN